MLKEALLVSCLISVFFVSCENKPADPKPSEIKTKEKVMSEPIFNLFEIDFGEEVQIKKQSIEGNYTSWLIENRSGKIVVETIVNETDSTDYPSISSYDNVFSNGLSNKEKYSVESIELKETVFRLVERTFPSGLNFIELYGQNVCKNKSHLLITGVDISNEDVIWLKQCFESIEFLCNDHQKD